MEHNMINPPNLCKPTREANKEKPNGIFEKKYRRGFSAIKMVCFLYQNRKHSFNNSNEYSIKSLNLTKLFTKVELGVAFLRLSTLSEA